MPSCCPALPTCVPILLTWRRYPARGLGFWLGVLSFLDDIRSRRGGLQGAVNSISTLPGGGGGWVTELFLPFPPSEFFVPFHCHFILCHSLGAGAQLSINRARVSFFLFTIYEARLVW
ncbi:hypothetical protein LY76DRAFT_85812 [Colletotrichum caudatum]|nr:hypothetical protein LY76DRAFT_85812 [Colletotrichum caudatum]